MSCRACASAQTDPTTGIVHADCEGCQVRSASTMPGWLRERFYMTIPEDRRAAFIKRTVAEYLRRKALMEQRQATA